MSNTVSQKLMLTVGWRIFLHFDGTMGYSSHQFL